MNSFCQARDGARKKALAAGAVILAVMILNIALWAQAPADRSAAGHPRAPAIGRDKSPGHDGAAGSSAPPELRAGGRPPMRDAADAGSRKARLDPESVPVPSDLPPGASADAMRSAVAACAEESGLESLQGVAISASGKTERAAGPTGPAAASWWWMLSGTLDDGSPATIICTYDAASGFAASTQ